MSAEEVRCKSRDICKNLIGSEFYKSAGTIMIYMPIMNEADTSEILADIFARGRRAVIPMVKDDNMYGIYVKKDSGYRRGKFGILEAIEEEYAEKTEIDAVIVPGIAFDRKGGRIGFGKGFYDRYLREMKAKKIGLCYDFQLIDDVCAEENDINMDCIITEKEILDLEPES